MLALLTLCLSISLVYLVLSVRLFNSLRRKAHLYAEPNATVASKGKPSAPRKESVIRRITVQQTGSEEAQNIPIHVVGRKDQTPADQSDETESLLRIRAIREAENEIHELDRKTYELSQSGNMEAAEIAGNHALAIAIAKLGGDHWLVGKLLNRLACIEMWNSKNFPALSHLESAAAIVSEWPDTCDNEIESIKRNLDYCHSRLGL